MKLYKKLILLILTVLISGCTASGLVIDEGSIPYNVLNVSNAYMYMHNESGIDISFSTKNIYQNITSLTCLYSKNIICENNKFTIITPGYYDVDFSLGFYGSINQDYHISTGVNGEHQPFCHMPRSAGSANAWGSSSFSCSIYLNEGDVVTPMVENDINTGDIHISDVNFRINLN